VRGIPRILRGIRRVERGFSFAELLVAIALFMAVVMGTSSLLISGGSLVSSSAKANTAMRLASAKMEQVKSLPFYVPWAGPPNVDIDDFYWRYGTDGTPLSNAQQMTDPWRPGEYGYEENVTDFAGYKRTTTIQYVHQVIDSQNPKTTHLAEATMVGKWVPKTIDPDYITKGQFDLPMGVDANGDPESLHMLMVEVQVSYMDNGVGRTYKERGLITDLLTLGAAAQKGALAIESMVMDNKSPPPQQIPASGYRDRPGETITCYVKLYAPGMTSQDTVQLYLWTSGSSYNIVPVSVTYYSGTESTSECTFKCIFDLSNLDPDPSKADIQHPLGPYNLHLTWQREGAPVLVDDFQGCFELKDWVLTINGVGSLFGPQFVAEYSVPGSNPKGITAGPDGNIWFTEYGTNRIGRINPEDGAIKHFGPVSKGSPNDITAEPDGKIWFTESTNWIGSSTPDGIINEFEIKSDGIPGGIPYGITAGEGPDGNQWCWFTEDASNKIGRISHDGSTIKEIPLAAGSNPKGITAGPDGNIWFTEYGTSRIGYIDPYDLTYTPKEIPLAAGSNPEGITAGPDGNIWFTEYGTNRIGCIDIQSDTYALREEYQVTTAGSRPSNITMIADYLWFTENGGTGKDKIGWMDTEGYCLGEYALRKTVPRRPYDITAGPDDNLWFSADLANSIGCVTPGGEDSPAWGYQEQTLRKLRIEGENFGSGSYQTTPPNVYLTSGSYKITAKTVSMSADQDSLIATFDLTSTSGWSAEMKWQLTVQAADNSGTKTWKDYFVMNPTPADVAVVTPSGKKQPENVYYYDFAYTNPNTPPELDVVKNVMVTGDYLYGLSAAYLDEPQGLGVELADEVDTPDEAATYWCRSDSLAASSETEIGLNDCGKASWAIVKFQQPAIISLRFPANGRALVLIRNPGVAIGDAVEADTYVWMNPDPISEYSLDPLSLYPAIYPWAITAESAAGGKIWFTEDGDIELGGEGTTYYHIGSLATDSSIYQEFKIGTRLCNPRGITLGPDNNIWFTEYSKDKIGRVNPTTGIITEFSLAASREPYGITKGPDNNIWFTERNGDKIGRVNLSASPITINEFDIAGSNPCGITAGPATDGNIWFTEDQGSGKDKIGRVNLSASPITITEFDLAAGSDPQCITKGPDNNIWFTENGIDKIGRITPAGTITHYNTLAAGGILPTSSNPWGITKGPDGNIWFTENGGNNMIGRVNLSASPITIDEFPIFTLSAGAKEITAGPDGNLWFTEYDNDKIGVFNLSYVPPIRPI